MGDEQRFIRPTPAGQPVECNADAIAGTPANQAASLPQNILSLTPTVITASAQRRLSGGETNAPCEARLGDPTCGVADLHAPGIHQPTARRVGPASWCKRLQREFKWGSILRIMLPSNVSAPPTGMLVITNRQRRGLDGVRRGTCRQGRGDRMKRMLTRAPRKQESWSLEPEVWECDWQANGSRVRSFFAACANQSLASF